ncbi:MAG: ribonuclease R [Gammaproteobacteria bacterium]|nr:ribonuclease R [Gammaproteobacteria bacterium]
MEPYEHAIPGPAEIMAEMEKRGVPQDFKALVKHFGLKGEKQRQGLQKKLKKLVRNGRLLLNRKNEYCLIDKIDAVVGKVAAHRDGFGFLIPEEGGEDVFLPPHEMRQLLDGDRVAVRLAGQDRKGRPKGALVEILERGKKTAVGRFVVDRGLNYVIEIASRAQDSYLIAANDTAGAKNGQLVKVEIIVYPTARREAQAKVTRILGNSDDPGMLVTLAIESFGLRDEWPKKVLAETSKLGTDVAEADKQGRTDLRDTPLVTIDGADARDFDDAVYAEPAGEDGKDWRLLVAIADVSHYVAKDNALDKEARRRGTSTYFPGRVVPMLPEALSNGLCSLNPDVDRLCLVCDMRISANGKVEHSKFYKAVMRSHARLTYNEVHTAVGEDDKQARDKLGELLPHIENLYGVYRGLAKARGRRGALDLELPEVVITMRDEHTIESVAPRHRNEAHMLIEECMIAANVQAARFLGKQRLPNLYRVHPQPEPDRFEELRVMLQELGFKVTKEARTQPRALNKILHDLRQRPDFAVLAVSVLRTLAQAVYQPANEGHYGLALDAYAHFTSPIRRYPDLLVHRGISHLIAGGKPGAFDYKLPDMEELGRTSSQLERQAEAASRHVESRYKAIYISEHVGDDFDGVITAIKHFGVFVMLQDLYVEGLIHVTNLGRDYYHLEHGGLRLRGERTGHTFSLGDKLRVRVVQVDTEEAKVDLRLAE